MTNKRYFFTGILACIGLCWGCASSQNVAFHAGQTYYTGARAYQKINKEILNKSATATGTTIGIKASSMMGNFLGKIGPEVGLRLTWAENDATYGDNQRITAGDTAVVVQAGMRIAIALLPNFELGIAAGTGLKSERVAVSTPHTNKEFSDELGVFPFYSEFSGRFYLGKAFAEVLVTLSPTALDDQSILVGGGLGI